LLRAYALDEWLITMSAVSSSFKTCGAKRLLAFRQYDGQ
jgi:hypothetical protein